MANGFQGTNNCLDSMIYPVLETEKMTTFIQNDKA